MVQNVLGSYRLLKVVHTGKASQLWQAYDNGRQRMAGMKAILPKAAKDSEQVGYLRQECKVGIEIKHPRIISAYNFDIDRSGTPYLAMESFSGPDLKKAESVRRKTGRRFSVFPRLSWNKQRRASGWITVKSQGNRDIKPENFLVNDTGQVKLIDFRLTKSHQLGEADADKAETAGDCPATCRRSRSAAVRWTSRQALPFGICMYELVAEIAHSGKPPEDAR